MPQGEGSEFKPQYLKKKKKKKRAQSIQCTMKTVGNKVLKVLVPLPRR
jgi:hypothetical protein